MNARFKLITSRTVERFEERLADFIAELGDDDVIVGVEFATTALSEDSVEFSALVHYQRTEAW